MELAGVNVGIGLRRSEYDEILSDMTVCIEGGGGCEARREGVLCASLSVR